MAQLTQRIRRAETRKEYEQVIDDFITQGYNIESSGENSTNMIKKKPPTASGHLLLALFTGILTLGISNVLYQFVRPTLDNVLIRHDRVDKE